MRERVDTLSHVNTLLVQKLCFFVKAIVPAIVSGRVGVDVLNRDLSGDYVLATPRATTK
jgi:hypothetical protein